MAGRPSVRRATDEKISSAVRRILKASGPEAVTMEAVSGDSGVAKTTLYRRYDNRFAMLADVLTRSKPYTWTVPDHVDRQTFRVIIRSLIDGLAEGLGGYYTFGQLLTSSRGFLQEWKSAVVAQPLSAFETYCVQGVEQGVLKPDVQPQMLFEFVIGGAVFNDASGSVSNDEWAIWASDTLWSAIAVDPESE